MLNEPGIENKEVYNLKVYDMGDLVVVYKSQFLHDVYLMKHKLEEQNITSYTRNENVTATIGVSMLEQYKLVVDEKDVERAIEILDKLE